MIRARARAAEEWLCGRFDAQSAGRRAAALSLHRTVCSFVNCDQSFGMTRISNASPEKCDREIERSIIRYYGKCNYSLLFIRIITQLTLRYICTFSFSNCPKAISTQILALLRTKRYSTSRVKSSLKENSTLAPLIECRASRLFWREPIFLYWIYPRRFFADDQSNTYIRE